MNSNPSLSYKYSRNEFKLLIDKEYPALKDTCFLDSAASPPLPISSINSFTSALTSNLYSNPHSRSHSSIKTTLEIDSIRNLILSELFHLNSVEERNDWDVIFTSGATASCKLLAHSFPWKEGQTLGNFKYIKESHTSLVGIRGVALARGAIVESLEVNEIEWEDSDNNGPTLFAYPAQCNATGSRLGLNYGTRIKQLHPETFILLDAAAYLSTSELQLDSIPLKLAPDFIACSFYKLFGYPTGLGCLVVKRSSSYILRPADYFGGGSIESMSVSKPFWQPSRFNPNPIQSNSKIIPTIHDGFEDGTQAFLSIIALGHSIKIHKKLFTNHSAVSQHTKSLTQFALKEMSKLHHENGLPIFKQHLAFKNYPASKLESHGPTIGFTLLDELGNPIGHVHLDKLATINSIQLRTGGLCNIGVLESALGLTDLDRKKDFERGRKCGDDEEFSGVKGEEDGELKPLGISRISFGAFSTIEDVLEWIGFLKKYFIVSNKFSTDSTNNVNNQLLPSLSNLPEIYLSSLMLYPIKSCGAQHIDSSSSQYESWSITKTGLKYDRQWMLVNSQTSKVLSQKQFPKMCLILPTVNLEKHKLEIRFDGKFYELDLDGEEFINDSVEEGERGEEVGICGDLVLARKGKKLNEIDNALSEYLGVACQLFRFSGDEQGGSSRHGHFNNFTSNSTSVQPFTVPLLLSNESPFLLISNSSVNQVHEWIVEDSIESSEYRQKDENFLLSPSTTNSNSTISSDCFRANFVFSSRMIGEYEGEENIFPPFLEDSIDFIRIGTETFSVLGKCRRCLMICVNQKTGVREKEPFSCLAKHRKSEKGRIEFGIHLVWRPELSSNPSGSISSVSEGDRVEFGYVQQ